MVIDPQRIREWIGNLAFLLGYSLEVFHQGDRHTHIRALRYDSMDHLTCVEIHYG